MGSPEMQPQEQPGIPIISAETLEALMSQYNDNSGDGQKWGERLNDMKDKVVATNPNLVKFMEMQVGLITEDFHLPMFMALMGTLVLIESQADADAMNSSFLSIDLE